MQDFWFSKTTWARLQETYYAGQRASNQRMTLNGKITSISWSAYALLVGLSRWRQGQMLHWHLPVIGSQTWGIEESQFIAKLHPGGGICSSRHAGSVFITAALALLKSQLQIVMSSGLPDALQRFWTNPCLTRIYNILSDFGIKIFEIFHWIPKIKRMIWGTVGPGDCPSTQHLIGTVIQMTSYNHTHPQIFGRLKTVDTLSDDENVNYMSQPKTPPVGKHRVARRAARGRLIKQSQKLVCDDPKKLGNMIRGNCRCKCGCFVNFRSDPLLERWLQHRKLMAKMTKLEKDKYVRSLAFEKYMRQHVGIFNTMMVSFPSAIHQPSHAVPTLGWGLWHSSQSRSRSLLPWVQAHPLFGAALVQPCLHEDVWSWKT